MPADDLYKLSAQKMILFLTYLDLYEDKYVPDEYLEWLEEKV